MLMSAVPLRASLDHGLPDRVWCSDAISRKCLRLADQGEPRRTLKSRVQSVQLDGIGRTRSCFPWSGDSGIQFQRRPAARAALPYDVQACVGQSGRGRGLASRVAYVRTGDLPARSCPVPRLGSEVPLFRMSHVFPRLDAIAFAEGTCMPAALSRLQVGTGFMRVPAHAEPLQSSAPNPALASARRRATETCNGGPVLLQRTGTV